MQSSAKSCLLICKNQNWSNYFEKVFYSSDSYDTELCMTPNIEAAISMKESYKPKVLFCCLSWPMENLNKLREMRESFPESGIIAVLDYTDKEISKLIFEMGIDDLVIRNKINADLVGHVLRTCTLRTTKPEREFGLGHLDLPIACHEIRAPLSTISSLAELIERSNKDVEISELIKNMRSSLNHALGVAKDYLALHKLESGSMQVESTDFCMDNLLKDSYEVVKYLVKSRKVEVSIDNDIDSSVTVTGDYQKLKQILVNILENAVKHARSVVEIKVAVVDCVVRFELFNDVEGGPTGQIEELFKPYFTANDRRSNIGLGLFIVKQLSEILKGRAWAQAEPDGMKFICQVPLGLSEAQKPTELPATTGNALVVGGSSSDSLLSLLGELQVGYQHLQSPEQVKKSWSEAAKVDYVFIFLKGDVGGFELFDEIQQDIDIAKITVMIFDYEFRAGDIKKLNARGIKHYLTRPLVKVDIVDCLNVISKDVWEKRLRPGISAGMEIEESATSYSILVVDDSSVIGRLVQSIIKDQGCECLLASNAAECYELLTDKSVDLIFLDVNLPDVKGFDLARQIKAKGGAKASIPIVLMTAMPLDKMKADGELKDFDATLQKPFRRDEVEALIKRYLQRTKGPINVSVDYQLEPLIPQYMEILHGYNRDLRSAIEKKEASEISRIGHMMKGSGSSYDFQQVSNWGNQIGQLVSEKKFSELDHLQREFAQYLNRMNVTYFDPTKPE